MKLKNILPFIALFLLISCSEKADFKKFIRLPEDHRWLKTDVKTIEFSIDDDSKMYDILFDFSHIADYQYSSVPIVFNIDSPDGKQDKFTIDLPIKDKLGKHLADCSGDICDLKFKIKEKIKLIQGNYKISIAQNFNGPYLPNVIGIGLNVESVK